MMHRIGGIEKAIDTGNIDYSPAVHQSQTDARKAKIDGIAADIPAQDVDLGRLRASWRWSAGARPTGRSTRPCAVRARKGLDVSHIHVRHIWPLPANLGALLRASTTCSCPR